MPIYEYVCKRCDHSFETLVLGQEQVACPECRSEELEKLFSVPGPPRTARGASLPMSCNPKLPPCGPGCCRL